MKIVYNTWFPFGNYHTLNFFGILFTKRKQLPESTITHESIHTAQMKEMLWLFFYLWYGVEYLLVRLFHKKQNCAYQDISFEEEAYNNAKNPDYLKTRKHYAWLKYIRLRSNHK